MLDIIARYFGIETNISTKNAALGFSRGGVLRNIHIHCKRKAMAVKLAAMALCSSGTAMQLLT